VSLQFTFTNSANEFPRKYKSSFKKKELIEK